MKENKDFNKDKQQKNPTWPQKPQQAPGNHPGRSDQHPQKKGNLDGNHRGGCGC